MVDLQSKVQDLQKEVAKLKEEREGLYKDLENLLLQNDASFWSGSSVLSERITQAEADLKDERKEKEKLSDQVLVLRESVSQLRELKRAADEALKDEMEKSRVLEGELAFYKQRGAHWIEERNMYLYEVEELKRTSMDLEHSLNAKSVELDTVKEQREDVEVKLEDTNKKLAQFELRLVECARIPALQTELKQSHDKSQKLAEEIKELEAKLESRENEIEASDLKLEESSQYANDLENKLKGLQETADIQSKQFREEIASLKADLESREKELALTSIDMEKADEAITSAKAQVELAVAEKECEMQRAREEYEEQISSLQCQLEEKESTIAHHAGIVDQLTEDKVNALTNLANAQSEVNDLKSKLGKATTQNGNGSVPRVEANGTDQPAKNSWWRGANSVQS